MKLPAMLFASHRRTVILRSTIWIALGATIFTQIDAHALKNELSAEATLLVSELKTGDEYADNTEFVTTITAARSNLFWGKGVGNIRIYSRVPKGEGEFEYYLLSNFYEQDQADWVNLGTFGYEDIDARVNGQDAFDSQPIS